MAEPARRSQSRTGAHRRGPVGGRKRAKPSAPTTRRALSAAEAASKTDFGALDKQFAKYLKRILSEWKTVRFGLTQDLVRQIAAARDLDDLARVQATPAGAEVLAAVLRDAAADAVAGTVTSAKEQGIPAAVPAMVAFNKQLSKRAAVIALILSEGLSDSAKRRALALSGGPLTPSTVAEQVRAHLNGLSEAYLVEQFTGAIVTAQGTARLHAMAHIEEDAEVRDYYISALLDKNTCKKCRKLDGKKYKTLAGIMMQMPTGRNKDCLGKERCRCAPIAVYKSEATD